MAKKKAVENIKYDPKNARLHSKENKDLINKSLKDLGTGRSIVIDNEDYIVAGNGVFEQAKELGIKPRIIETDGTELVIIKRTDLNYDDEKRRQLAIADNATGETSEWNLEELTEDEIYDWDIEILIEKKPEDEQYTRKIKSPIYIPSETKPKLSELVDKTRALTLLSEIESSKLNDSVKEFLKLAAYRHYTFDYSKIADYYANADKETQKLMEKSALIIIDFNSAIDNGFIGLTEKIAEMFKIDYE